MVTTWLGNNTFNGISGRLQYTAFSDSRSRTLDRMCKLVKVLSGGNPRGDKSIPTCLVSIDTGYRVPRGWRNNIVSALTYGQTCLLYSQPRLGERRIQIRTERTGVWSQLSGFCRKPMIGVTTHSEEHDNGEHTGDSAGTHNGVYHGLYGIISPKPKFASGISHRGLQVKIDLLSETRSNAS